MRWVFLSVIALSLGFGQIAYADGIDTRARQLATDTNYKVRLSAALWLAKKKDPRAIDALTTAMEKDSEADIRELAARALLKLMSSHTPADVRSRAFAALQRVAKKDEDRTVRRRAKRALRKLEDLHAATPSEGQTVAATGKRPSGILVHIGKPTLGKHSIPKGTDAALEKAVSTELQGKLPERYYKLAASSAELPTQAELQRDNIRGWYVGSSVTAMDVTAKGTMADVRCSLTIRVNPWLGKDAKQRLTANDTASATGSATVQGSNSKREIGYAKRDCLIAVAEQLTANRVIPFLKERNPQTRRRSASKSSDQSSGNGAGNASSRVRVSRSHAGR